MSVDLDQRASLEPELGDEASVGRVELRRLARLVVLERVDRRTPPGATDHRPARVAEAGAEGAEEADASKQTASA